MHQQLGRIDDTAAQDHFASRGGALDACHRARTRCPDARPFSSTSFVACACVITLKVGSLQNRQQKRFGRTVPPAILDVFLVEPGTTFRLRAAEVPVGIGLITQLARCRQKRFVRQRADRGSPRRSAGHPLLGTATRRANCPRAARNTGSTSSYPQPALPARRQLSKSSRWPRMKVIALMALEPPSTLPRGNVRRRLPSPGSGSVA